MHFSPTHATCPAHLIIDLIAPKNMSFQNVLNVVFIVKVLIHISDVSYVKPLSKIIMYRLIMLVSKIKLMPRMEGFET
jgi:hypothetical protein